MRPRFMPRPVSLLDSHEFRFLNHERSVPPEQYAEPGSDLLWDYNFHYFDGLMAPGSDQRSKVEWIRTWLKHVPIGSRPAWDAYPTSRRILNWVKWASSTDPEPPPLFNANLATQARHLEQTLEFHLMANHLMANAAALTMAGLYFGGDEGDGWLERGGALLAAELDEQFLSDGAHYERSPTYHAVVLEDLLDLVQVARNTNADLPDQVGPVLEAASRWLSLMLRPDGRVPLFNDAAYDQAPDARELLAYSARVRDDEVDPDTDALDLIGPSGYFRYAQGRLFVVGDVGPVGPDYQPGHTHCDMLSFELCWEGRPIIVDTGTSTYQRGPRRHAERGTAAHNTVQLGNREQSEIWASFRVARRASAEHVEVKGRSLSARIRAFPGDWARIERRWHFDGESLVVEELILENPADLPAISRFHFHPAVSLEPSERGWTADDLQLRFEGALRVSRVPYRYAPEFNLLVDALCLEVEFGRALRLHIGP